jgi:hemolysin D
VILRLQATFDLLRRYSDGFRSAWNVRELLDGPQRTAAELDFLPASLELVETPPHPAPRWAMRILIALSATIVLVAVVGKLDIVATAKGKVLPSERVKVIQPAITGVTRRILVRDGQRVSAGQLLIVLDTTQAAADSGKAKEDRVNALLAIAGAQAVLDAQSKGGAPKVAPVRDANQDDQRQAQELADSQIRELRDKLSSASGELEKRIAERETALAEIAKLEATTPLARREADDFRQLSVNNYVSKHDYLDKEQTALTAEHELIAQRSHVTELAAAITQQRAEVQSLTSTFRREQYDALTKAGEQLQGSNADETKANTREGLLSLTAPVGGTVQQLSVHTLGGVVTTAQSLMEIVPDDTLEIEASIENKDIGFVEAGQEASVKIDAFPYTQYGYLKGTVVAVSNDAVPDKKTGLVFTARIRLKTAALNIHGKSVAITPGMQVTADIRTGKRSVASYFLSPLVENLQESMRER